MTWFVAIAIGMTLVALAWLLPPLLRRRPPAGGVARSASNLAVLRDQLAELDADLAHGTLAPEQHGRSRAELERRVLEDVTVEPGAGGGGAARGHWAAVAVGVLVPAAALLLYLQIGSPDALRQQSVHGESALTAEQIEQMVARLAARLEANPEDAAGWSLLARSYFAMGRFPEAVTAYAKAVKLKNDDAGLYADYADALAMSQGRRIDEPVLALIKQALEIDPDHPKALALAGTAAYDHKDYQKAAAYLERLQRQVPPDSELARALAERLEEVRAQVGGKGAGGPVASKGGDRPAASAAGGATIQGRVALAPALAAKASPTDTVFILARAPEGSRMPLAILKRQVKDLPFEFTLSDEQAMSPEMKLSKFREVVIAARISKSGGATPQSGDLQGTASAVKVGAAGINVLIDSVVP